MALEIFESTQAGLSNAVVGAEGVTNSVAAVSTAARNVRAILVDNTNGGVPVFVKLFDIASGSVSVGTSHPKAIVRAPANGKARVQFKEPIVFATAITVIASTAPGTGSAGQAAPATGQEPTVEIYA